MHCYMKKELTILLCLLTAGTSVSAQKLTDHVNPFLGTATLWEPEDLGYVRHRESRTWGAETFPGAALPNAMVQATPVTMYHSGSGYQYEDKTIFGFSHTAKGHWNLAHVPILPVTGRVNPTAVFEPIRLCGTTVQRATLHNQDFINNLHIGIGDTVVVYKSGEIIPKIKRSVPEKRPAGVSDFRLPDVCPVCGGPIVQEEGMSDKKCINPNCPAQLERHLINFVGRSAMDIKGFGEENVLTLVREKLLADIADIYTLKDHRQEMLDKKLIGLEKSTDKLLAAIENSKKNEPWRLLAGLAIENVGSASARTIMRHFGSFEKLMQADRETLLSVKDVGPATAAAIVSFFSAKENRELMERLSAAGLTMAEEVKSAGSELAGKTFAVTGDVYKFKNRNELTVFIEERGGKCAGSVSKKTFALINNDPGSMSGKNKKARELGIPIITEEEFLRALEEGEYNAD